MGELRLGAEDDASPLTTQENPAKNLVYIMNIPECTLETRENVRDPSKNTNEEDDRKPSPVEKTNQITSNVQLNAYEESDSEEDLKKAQEAKKNTWRTQKIIHTEFESDDDVDEQTQNSRNVKTEGKVQVKKKLYTIMNSVVTKRKESVPTQKKLRKPKMATKIKRKMMKMTRLLCPTK